MSIRYGKAFKIPRKIAKYLLSYVIYPIVIRIWKLPKVKSIDETLDHLINQGGSICRYGDGEFLYIIDKLNLPFQKYDNELAQRMREILISNDANILVGLPIGYQSLKGVEPGSRRVWRSQIAWIYPRLKKYLSEEKQYWNASMTRFYYEYEDKNISRRYIEKLLRLWENRHVIIIEGEKSRFGVGNTLLSKTKSVARILAPKHHAFSKYHEILEKAKTMNKEALYLIALGPTATVLAYDLAKSGRQAIDIGNVDIEYEWYLRGAKEKIKIEGKYTSEAIGGRNVADVKNEQYESEILLRIL